MPDPCTREAAREWGRRHAEMRGASVVVMRHSGTARGWWRVVTSGGPDDHLCVDAYDRIVAEMRQGAVALYSRDGDRLLIRTAPRLRTRW